MCPRHCQWAHFSPSGAVCIVRLAAEESGAQWNQGVVSEFNKDVEASRRFIGVRRGMRDPPSRIMRSIAKAIAPPRWLQLKGQWLRRPLEGKGKHHAFVSG